MKWLHNKVQALELCVAWLMTVSGSMMYFGGLNLGTKILGVIILMVSIIITFIAFVGLDTPRVKVKVEDHIVDHEDFMEAQEHEEKQEE